MPLRPYVGRGCTKSETMSVLLIHHQPERNVKHSTRNQVAGYCFMRYRGLAFRPPFAIHTLDKLSLGFAGSPNTSLFACAAASI